MDNRLRQALRVVSTAAASFLETTPDRERLLSTVVRAVTEVVPGTCIIALHTEDGTAIIPSAIHDEDPQVLATYRPFLGTRRELSASQISRSALQTGTLFQPAVDLDALAGQTPADSLAAMRAVGVRGMIVVPLRSRGQLLGVLSLLRHRADRPPLDDLDREIVEHLANHAALALANARLLGERQRMETEVQASRFLDAVVDNIPDMVFVKDAAELRFVRFNRAVEELLGVPRAELIGKNDRDFFPEDEAQFFIAKDRETLANKKLVEIPEEPIETRAGRRWLHTKKVPILDEDGTPRFLLGISEDITDKKRVLADLAAAVDKATAANKELEAFSYSVAHDLRAPLRAIDGFSQALLEDYATALDATGQRHLERIRAAAQRMGMLIDDLLRLSRVTRHEHRPELVDLSALARASIAQLERAEPEREVEIVIADHLQALADPKLVSIMFDNLFSNAWKFTGKVAAPRIELGRVREEGQQIFFVRDNGAGFDMAYKGQLFGVFHRLHPQHEFPGTGVGLATVKRIVDRHGGRIWAEAAPGQGATFFFTFPEDSDS